MRHLTHVKNGYVRTLLILTLHPCPVSSASVSGKPVSGEEYKNEGLGQTWKDPWPASDWTVRQVSQTLYEFYIPTLVYVLIDRHRKRLSKLGWETSLCSNCEGKIKSYLSTGKWRDVRVKIRHVYLKEGGKKYLVVKVYKDTETTRGVRGGINRFQDGCCATVLTRVDRPLSNVHLLGTEDKTRTEGISCKSTQHKTVTTIVFTDSWTLTSLRHKTIETE